MIRWLAQALAALALVMFVATGASHELLHLDEPAAAHAEAHAHTAAIQHAGHVRLDLPASGCSAHSAAAHAAAPAPCASLVAPPVIATVAWRPAADALVRQLGPTIPHGPPRA